METNHSASKPGQYLTLRLKSQFYGIPIGAVREINQMAEIAEVPRTPSFVIGVMNLRGKVIPVIDLRQKFGMEPTGHTKETCIVVIEAQVGQVGMVVDAVSEVVDFTAAQIEPAPVLGNEKDLAFVTGMGKRDNQVIILVDVVNALSKEEFSRVAEAQTRLQGQVKRIA